MKVTVYEMSGWGDEQEVGSFQLRAGQVVCDHPDDDLLRNMLNTPVHANGQLYSAQRDPEEWLENLQYQYRSAYLSASPPEGRAGTKSLPEPKPEKPKPFPRPEQAKVEELPKAPTQMTPPVPPPQLPPPQYAPEEEASPEALPPPTTAPQEPAPETQAPEPISETEQRADEIATALAKKAPGIWQKVGGAGKTVKDRMLRFKNWLENRYGKTQTKLILASGSLIGWTATGVGALFGKVVWWPGSMYWGSLPAIAIAEAYMQTSRLSQNKSSKPLQIVKTEEEPVADDVKSLNGEKAFTQSKQYPTLSEQEINQIATRLVYRLIRLSKQEHEKITGGGDRNGFPDIRRKMLPMRVKQFGKESSPEKPKGAAPEISEKPEPPKPSPPKSPTPQAPPEPQYTATPVEPPSLRPSRVVATRSEEPSATPEFLALQGGRVQFQDFQEQSAKPFVRGEEFDLDSYEEAVKRNFKQINDWSRDSFGKEVEAYTPLEKYGVAAWGSHSFRPANDFLRKGISPPEQEKWRIEKIIRAMDLAITKTRMPEDVVVYRGIENGVLEDPNSLVGKVISDKGFASTSFRRSIAEGFTRGRGGVVMEIRVPQGTPVIPVSYVAGRTAEHELTLGRGSRIRITGHRKDKRTGADILTAEVVNE